MQLATLIISFTEDCLSLSSVWACKLGEQWYWEEVGAGGLMGQQTLPGTEGDS